MFYYLGLCKLVHLDAEIDEDDGTDSTDIGIDSTAESKGIIDAVSHNGNEQDTCGGTRRVIYKAIDGIIVPHQYGEGIVPRNG